MFLNKKYGLLSKNKIKAVKFESSDRRDATALVTILQLFVWQHVDVNVKPSMVSLPLVHSWAHK